MNYRVMVKHSDMKRAMGLGSGGSLVDKKIFQLMFDKERAEEIAQAIRDSYSDAVVTVAKF